MCVRACVSVCVFPVSVMRTEKQTRPTTTLSEVLCSALVLIRWETGRIGFDSVDCISRRVLHCVMCGEECPNRCDIIGLSIAFRDAGCLPCCRAAVSLRSRGPFLLRRGAAQMTGLSGLLFQSCSSTVCTQETQGQGTQGPVGVFVCVRDCVV